MKRRGGKSGGRFEAARQAQQERADAIKEYRAALRELQGASKRMDYDLEITGLPKAGASELSFAGISTDEIRQHAEDFRNMRKDEVREEIQRTAGARSGEAAHDNVRAIMEATDPDKRDELRDMIEENYDIMDIASDMLQSDGGEQALEDFIDNYDADDLLPDFDDDDFFELI